MKYVILEKAKRVQVKPYQRKGKYVIGYQRFDPRQKEISEMLEKPNKLGERIYPKGEIRWSKPILGIGAKVVYMSPDEYIDRIHISKRMTSKQLSEYQKTAIKHGLKGVAEYPPFSQQSINHIKAQIEQGKEIEMPFIEYDDRGIVTSQEGYHRTLVAKEMGSKQIPVMVIGEGAEQVELFKEVEKIQKEIFKKPSKSALEGTVFRGVTESEFRAIADMTRLDFKYGATLGEFWGEDFEAARAAAKVASQRKGERGYGEARYVIEAKRPSGYVSGAPGMHPKITTKDVIRVYNADTGEIIWEGGKPYEHREIGEKQRAFAERFKGVWKYNPETEVLIGERFPHVVPRYYYHRPPMKEKVKKGIKAYLSRGWGGEKEAIDREFKTKNAKVVWLSPTISYGIEDTLKVDLAQLDPKDLRHTGQAEGNVWHLGNIPESAIVREKKIWEVKKGMYVTLEKAERTSREQLQKIFDEFIPHCQKYLGLKEIPKIKLIDAKVSKKKKTFGIHHEDKNIIELNVRDRHPIDILRTLCHELTHHEQDQENSKKTDLGREDDANASAGFIVRKFIKKHPNLFSLGALEK